MTKQRHWKQQWDPNAKFIYRRRLKLQRKEPPHEVFYVDQFEDVDIAFWGISRVRRLWEQQAIELKHFKAPTFKPGVVTQNAPVSKVSSVPPEIAIETELPAIEPDPEPAEVDPAPGIEEVSKSASDEPTPAEPAAELDPEPEAP
jgi:hypothetical protein